MQKCVQNNVQIETRYTISNVDYITLVLFEFYYTHCKDTHSVRKVLMGFRSGMFAKVYMMQISNLCWSVQSQYFLFTLHCQNKKTSWCLFTKKKSLHIKWCSHQKTKVLCVPWRERYFRTYHEEPPHENCIHNQYKLNNTGLLSPFFKTCKRFSWQTVSQQVDQQRGG